jgi:hypothetical protein
MIRMRPCHWLQAAGTQTSRTVTIDAICAACLDCRWEEDLWAMKRMKTF